MTRKLPVGCVRPAFVVPGGDAQSRGVVPGVRPRGVWSPAIRSRGMVRGMIPGKGMVRRHYTPSGQTDTCENITFPQFRLRAVKIK